MSNFLNERIKRKMENTIDLKKFKRFRSDSNKFLLCRACGTWFENKGDRMKKHEKCVKKQVQ